MKMTMYVGENVFKLSCFNIIIMEEEVHLYSRSHINKMYNVIKYWYHVSLAAGDHPMADT